MRQLFFSLLLLGSIFTGSALPQADQPASVVVPDSVQMLVDSLIRELQEAKIHELSMRDKLDASGRRPTKTLSGRLSSDSVSTPSVVSRRACLW